MKYAIVTGASPSSIGFLAAKKLASSEFGYKVILACRSEQKGREAESMIRSADATSQVVYLNLDLASFDSIRAFVGEVHGLDGGAIPTKYGLKALVNNAGVGFGRDTPHLETSDGLEEIVGVNHFGTFLLTQLLLDDLKRAEGGARVVTVSSSLHDANRFSKKSSGEDASEDSQKKLLLPNFPEGLLQSKDGFDGSQAYKVSKLCNLWFTYELQRQLDDGAPQVIANAISPGFIPATGLTRRAGLLGTFFLQYVLDPWRYIGMGITRSPDEGAEVIVQVCTSDIASKGGQYFGLPKHKTTIEAIASSDESMDESKAKFLWDLSLRTCKL